MMASQSDILIFLHRYANQKKRAQHCRIYKNAVRFPLRFPAIMYVVSHALVNLTTKYFLFLRL